MDAAHTKPAQAEPVEAGSPALRHAKGERDFQSHRADFPGLADGWSYLDSAATAQKPQAVIDAIARAYGDEYATVHRGVYERSATMTERYEAARERTARFMGAGNANEIVFVRGATEGINLIASSWGTANIGKGDRIVLSALEHHSNIVPWQMLAERVGAEILVAPLTDDHRIDEDALIAMLDERVKLVALAHVSNVLGSIVDGRRIADAAHKVGAMLLLDGCQAAPRIPVDVSALDADFYVWSGHKLYGPTGIGVLYAKADLLSDMAPYQGGGSMIETVSWDGTTYAPAPQRFEAGTPHIVGAVGLHAAIDYVDGIGIEAIDRHERALATAAREALHGINSLTLFGPADGTGILSFAMEGVHPHDIGTILDEESVAIRAGHHCCQPLMQTLGVPATARASFGIYNGPEDVEKLVKGLIRVQRIFG
ncbi:MAG: cysteine desulfurase [Pacificimonas sp.]|jgi:cysteine desulfurase/selenocysteine lyase|nr:cysteine desulfurase [Pacificimonas sp.]